MQPGAFAVRIPSNESLSRSSGMIGNWDEATECTQEAFVRAWQH